MSGSRRTLQRLLIWMQPSIFCGLPCMASSRSRWRNSFKVARTKEMCCSSRPCVLFFSPGKYGHYLKFFLSRSKLSSLSGHCSLRREVFYVCYYVFYCLNTYRSALDQSYCCLVVAFTFPCIVEWQYDGIDLYRAKKWASLYVSCELPAARRWPDHDNTSPLVAYSARWCA